MHLTREQKDLIRWAHDSAKAVHAGAVRKGANLPFVAHPRRVAGSAHSYIAYQQYVPENDPAVVVAAALLHDSIEDGHIHPNAVEIVFGKEVCRLVCALTSFPEPGLNRRSRKFRMCEKFRKASCDAQFIKLLDRLDNVITIEQLDPGFRRLYAIESIELVNAIQAVWSGRVAPLPEVFYDLCTTIRSAVSPYLPLAID